MNNVEIPEGAIWIAVYGFVFGPVAVVFAWLVLTIPLWVCAVGVVLVAVVTGAYFAGFLRAVREVGQR